MLATKVTVLELLEAAQADWNFGRQHSTRAGRHCVHFRRYGPLAVTACPSPNAYTLALRRKVRCSRTVNKTLFARAGMPPAPGPVSNLRQEGEH